MNEVIAFNGGHNKVRYLPKFSLKKSQSTSFTSVFLGFFGRNAGQANLTSEIDNILFFYEFLTLLVCFYHLVDLTKASKDIQTLQLLVPQLTLFDLG